jgi:hypothetical protein
MMQIVNMPTMENIEHPIRHDQGARYFANSHFEILNLENFIL